MKYDPQGTGAALDDLQVRRLKNWESAQRLARWAADAEQAGLGHGLSVTSPEANQHLAQDPADAVQATRRAFEEAGFEVRYTPSKRDPDHHTVIIPKPVTEEVATRFNAVLGRTRKRK